MDTNPEHQFDFWLGEWEAAWGENERGLNRVERILDGKFVQENFTAPDFTGMSVSAYDPERKLWCQTWVDSNGTYLDGKQIAKETVSDLAEKTHMLGVGAQERFELSLAKSEASVEAVDSCTPDEVDYILSPIVAEGELFVRVFKPGPVFLAVFRGPEGEVVKEACDFVVARHTQFTRLVRD